MLNLLRLILRPRSRFNSWVEIIRAINKPKSGLYCVLVWRVGDGEISRQMSVFHLMSKKLSKIDRLLDDSPVIVRTGHFERIEFLVEQINAFDGPLRAAVVED